MFNYYKILAFLKRDFYNEVSYKFSFIMSFFGIFLSVFLFYFISKLFGKMAVPYLKSYGGDYFSFVLIGIAFSSYLKDGLQSFSASIRNEQMMGTMESILVSPTSISTVIVSSSLWSFLYTSFRVLIYLVIGSLIFKVDMSKANIPVSLLILILTIISFSSLGILSAGFIMVLKKGDPISWVFGSLSSLLGGVFYPISILPSWLQKVSYLLPITYSLQAFRHSILQGYGIQALSGDIITLFIFSLIMMPVSIVVFNYAIKKAKKDGSLTHY